MINSPKNDIIRYLLLISKYIILPLDSLLFISLEYLEKTLEVSKDVGIDCFDPYTHMFELGSANTSTLIRSRLCLTSDTFARTMTYLGVVYS